MKKFLSFVSGSIFGITLTFSAMFGFILWFLGGCVENDKKRTYESYSNPTYRSYTRRYN